MDAVDAKVNRGADAVDVVNRGVDAVDVDSRPPGGEVNRDVDAVDVEVAACRNRTCRQVAPRRVSISSYCDVPEVVACCG